MHRAVERSRRKLNIVMSKFCRSMCWDFIGHRLINLRVPGNYAEDWVNLSGVGMDMFMLKISGPWNWWVAHRQVKEGN